MQISRMDLADYGSPSTIVAAILKAEPDLPLPVPVEELSAALDIQRIAELTTEGFEGGLLTDRDRSTGIILVRSGGNRQRRRFTIGHELGHFLVAGHVPNAEGQFLCSSRDLALLSAKEGDRRARMEVEANTFSSLLLMPPTRLRPMLGSRRDPSFEHLLELASTFDVSKEAMARTYVDYHPADLAIVFVQNGAVRWVKRSMKFPRVTVRKGDKIPDRSSFSKQRTAGRGELVNCLPDTWIDVERGRRAPELYEQVLLQSNGFAMIMLWAEMPEADEDEVDDDRTARERLRDRMAGRGW